MEGQTDNPRVEALRLRQIKNFLTILFVSQGTPMLLMGDEVRRSQRGNNNAYCQDNELSWFDWNDLETHAGLLRFVRGLIRFTQAREIFREERFWVSAGQEAHLTWHGVRLGQPDWSDDSHSLAFELHQPDAERDEHLYVMLNAYWEALSFELPAGRRWRRIVDTALPAPDDFSDSETAPPVKGGKYRLEARSVAILMARL